MVQQWQPGRGVFGLLSGVAPGRRDAVYLEDRSGTAYTFAETEALARSVAGYLAEKGVKRGDRVAIHLQNRAEVAVLLYAVSLLGGIYVVLNSSLRPHGLRKVLDQAEPVAIFVDEATIANVEDPDAIPIRVALMEEVPSSWADWSEVAGHEAFEGDWGGYDVDAVSLVFTSGSTGTPRGVTLSHDNICYAVGAIQDRLRYRARDTVGVFLPLAFDYGLYQVFLAAQAGAKLYIGDPSQVGPRLPRVLAEAEVSVLPGVPSVYAALLALARRRPFELPNLRAITNTGERLPLSYIDEMRELFPGLDVFVMYGLTECKRVSIMTPAEFETHRESVGRPLAGTEVYAVDAEGNRLPAGEAGELVVRGRHVAHGYWRAPEETARRFRKRAPHGAVELFTGDTGSVDEEGFLHFAARSDDLLKHRGNRISPVEIENEACSLDGIVEASLLQREEDDTLHLFVTASGEVDPEWVLRSLGELLEPAKVPEFVRVLPEMPTSINGKIDRKALAASLSD